MQTTVSQRPKLALGLREAVCRMPFTWGRAALVSSIGRRLLLCALPALASCTSPPGPPNVDETRRRPLNIAAAVDLLACRNEAHNTKLLLNDKELALQEAQSNRAANAVERANLLRTHLQLLADHQQVRPPQVNQVILVHFDSGSSDLKRPSPATNAMIEAAKSAPLVVLRGRTDGSKETLGDSRLARGRTAAVYEFLVSAGIRPDRIRSTYQAIGDHLADNSSAAGRAKNRRVEVEIYAATPTAWMPPKDLHD
ncbi:OmpA family protein [Paucibacter sp. B51]|uniref:OmpA family protein n=1 Tax=Paucibacter sp. B51 TaxID=2993315 RepID=UPI0022EBF332|nr:OmpA family protein [Paucibacter sp. B51]